MLCFATKNNFKNIYDALIFASKMFTVNLFVLHFYIFHYCMNKKEIKNFPE